MIGSGLGGLVSALVLAKEGYKVCVLEKNNQYGGNLQTFSRDKLIFDTGVHYLGGLAPGQNLFQYFSYLGIMDDLDIEEMDKDAFDKISFEGDENEYPHAQGYENFVKQLAEFFPEEKINLENYCKDIQYVCDQFPRYNLVNNGKYNEEVLHLNTQVFIESVTSNKKLQAVLLGSNLLYAGQPEVTPLYVHALTVNSYLQSAYKCVKGGSQISKLLIKKLREFGAEVFKRSEVVSTIFHEEGSIASVKTKNGNEFFGDKFISNVDIRATFQFIGESHFKKSFVNRVKSWEPITSCFSIYLVLKPNSLAYFNHNYYHFSTLNQVWKTFEYQNLSWPETFMLSSTASKKNPKFAESLTGISYLSFEDVKQWEKTINTIVDENERGIAYDDFKNELAEKFISGIEKKIPNVREHIKAVYTSSPLSYRDYIGGTDGNMYGYIKESTNPLKTMVSPTTKIPNLYLTGQSVNMHGILGVTIGAFTTCSRILGNELLNERLKSITK